MLKELKIEIALMTFFQAPTIAQLVIKIGENRTGIVDGEFTTLLDQIESLSEEEVHRWLQQHQT